MVETLNLITHLHISALLTTTTRARPSPRPNSRTPRVFPHLCPVPRRTLRTLPWRRHSIKVDRRVCARARARTRPRWRTGTY